PRPPPRPSLFPYTTLFRSLLGLWLGAMIVLAAFVLIHLDTRASLAGFFKGERLAYPGGYENASAATWVLAMWPALLLAAPRVLQDRKSTRLNSSHRTTSYA